jgi:hypothetical protein
LRCKRTLDYDAGRYDERLWCPKEASVLDLAMMIEGQY